MRAPSRSKLSGPTACCLACVIGLPRSPDSLVPRAGRAFHLYLVHIVSSQLCAPVCVHLALCSHLLFSAILELLGGRGHSFFISLLDEHSLGVNLRVSNTLLPDESTGLLSSAESEGMLVEQQCPPPHGCTPHPSIQLQAEPRGLCGRPD